MQLTAALTAIVMALPAVMGAATPEAYKNIPNVPVYPGQTPRRPRMPLSRPSISAPLQITVLTFISLQLEACIQEWFGTAPLCKGKCPRGWKQVWKSERAGGCERENPFKIIEDCRNLSSKKCLTGTKKLCEICWDADKYGH